MTRSETSQFKDIRQIRVISVGIYESILRGRGHFSFSYINKSTCNT